MMKFLKRLFRRQGKPKPEPQSLPRGVAQTQTEQDTTREHMEAGVADDRKKRGATDKRP
jgi:hypothetical protein